MVVEIWSEPQQQLSPIWHVQEVLSPDLEGRYRKRGNAKKTRISARTARVMGRSVIKPTKSPWEIRDVVFEDVGFEHNN